MAAREGGSCRIVSEVRIDRGEKVEYLELDYWLVVVVVVAAVMR